MQRVNLSAGKASFTILGPDVVPLTAAYARASERRKRAYWPILARHARDAMVGQLEAGLGADGAPLPPPKAISRQWYQDRGLEWRGPSMSPQNRKSRFHRHLRVIAFPAGKPDRVIGFWSHGTAQLAHYHATGTAGRGRPYFDGAGKIRGWRGLPGQVTGIVRNIVGLSAEWLALAVSRARAEWMSRFGGGAATLAIPAPLPAPPVPITPPPLVANPRGLGTAARLLERYPFLAEVNPRDAFAQPPRRLGLLRRLARRVASFFGSLFG